jgi:outer membrane protein assembly factor BamB
VWQVPLDPSQPPGWSLSLFQNLLLVDGQNTIQARDLSNGHLVWSTGPLKGNGISFEPAMSNGVIYVATEERLPPSRLFQHPRYWVYAFNAQSGKLVRMLEDGDSSFQPGSIKADQEHVYVVGSQLFSGLEYRPPELELDVLGV